MVKKLKRSYYDLLSLIKRTDLSGYTDQQLLESSMALKRNLQEGVEQAQILASAYALVYESARRVLRIDLYDAQILAGIALNEGYIIEMQTGEGKTFAAVFSVYVNALSGKGVHVLTFNDYLARRDAEWVGPIYQMLGLTVGYINAGMGLAEKQSAYQCDITYATAKEAGFDYLRDSLCYDQNDLVHRPFESAIIDEADSILIDEARSPLVIAGATQIETRNTEKIADLVKTLIYEVDYDTDAYKRNVFLTEEGTSKVERILGLENLYALENIHLLTGINCALHAETLLTRDVNYIVKDGHVELIDELTGRIALNRHWPDGLQEAVLAKEGLRPQESGVILGSIALQSFLSLYPKIAGMTATAITSEKEFEEIYRLDVCPIKPTKPCIRTDYEDVIFADKESKVAAVIAEVIRVHASGRPILIGTASVEESDMLANRLNEKGVPCTVLNAKNDELEANIIKKAGERNAITVSTNMAGRGVDIKLGNGNQREWEEISALGGLYIIGMNKNESPRIDNQLRGRCARQGDPGSSRFFISLEDDLLVRFGLGDFTKHKKFTQNEKKQIIDKSLTVQIAHIQRIIDGQNHEIRHILNKYAFILEKQRRVLNRRRCEVLTCEKDILVKQITLFQIDRCWCDYLEYVSYIREGIHLVSLSREDPLHQYYLLLQEAFEDMLAKIDAGIAEELIRSEGASRTAKITKLIGPSATWTYVVSDNEFMNRVKKTRYPSEDVHFVSMKFIFTRPIYFFQKALTEFSNAIKRAF